MMNIYMNLKQQQQQQQQQQQKQQQNDSNCHFYHFSLLVPCSNKLPGSLSFYS